MTVGYATLGSEKSIANLKRHKRQQNRETGADLGLELRWFEPEDHP
jgi:hypothetical protein